jgi:cyclic pyranopterin phosphate synthase
MLKLVTILYLNHATKHRKTINLSPSKEVMIQPLIDQFQRKINYLRLSITDRCDFRCVYCMNEDMTFLPRDEVLSLEESLRLVKIFTSLGVTKLRVTGGEPLVRKNIGWLFKELSQIEALKEVVLTTNGSQLVQHAPMLKNAHVNRINISLDSLDPVNFKKITRTGDLNKVLLGIDEAIQQGFSNLKLNTVLMKGINDHEAIDLVNFAIDKKMDISFIEEMPLGNIDHTRKDTFISNDEVLKNLQNYFNLIPTTFTSGGPAKYWQLANQSTKVGFISPHSHNFCDTCNRVRVSSKGELFLCLGQEEKIELMPLLRQYPNEDWPIQKAIIESMMVKPEAHDFNLEITQPAVVRFMSHTGG